MEHPPSSLDRLSRGSDAPWFVRLRRVLLCAVLASCLLAVAVGGHHLFVLLDAGLAFRTQIAEAMSDPRLMVPLLVLYILLLTIPFVPGAELGFLILLICGSEAAAPVYTATLAALALSFALGRAVPLRILIDVCERLGLAKIAAFLDRCGTEEVAGIECQKTLGPRSGWARHLLRYRCVCLGALFNMPGNTLLGGGGGIALAAGISRALTFPQFALTAMVAVSPVPLFFIISCALAG